MNPLQKKWKQIRLNIEHSRKTNTLGHLARQNEHDEPTKKRPG